MEKLFVKNNGKGWFACCKGKDLQGNECCAFMNVGFKKNEEPTINPAIVEVRDGFHTSYLMKNGTAVLKFMILEYSVVPFKKETQAQQSNPYQQQTLNSTMWGGQTPQVNGVEPDDLPFY